MDGGDLKLPEVDANGRTSDTILSTDTMTPKLLARTRLFDPLIGSTLSIIH